MLPWPGIGHSLAHGYADAYHGHHGHRPEATDLAGEAEVLCFLNEARVRRGQYNVPHYVVKGALVLGVRGC